MEILHSIFYDTRILDAIPHLNNYPQMLPFIGRHWQDSKYKTLLLGESHYIPMDELMADYPERDYLNSWYRSSSKGLPEYYTDYINTRLVINIAENTTECGFRKPLTIFYNVKTAIKEKVTSLSDDQYIYPYFSFYNYFQRPAITEGESIVNSEKDNEIAYNMLLDIIDIINPEKIIFISKKAFVAFNCEKYKRGGDVFFEKLQIESIPHPSCAWWNRKSVSYGNRTGREKFIQIVNGLA